MAPSQILLIHSPNWLYLYPGALLTMIGVICFVIFEFSSSVELAISLAALSGAFILFGIQLLLFQDWQNTCTQY